MLKIVLLVLIDFILFAPWVMALLWDKYYVYTGNRYGVGSDTHVSSIRIYSGAIKILVVLWAILVTYTIHSI